MFYGKEYNRNFDMIDQDFRSLSPNGFDGSLIICFSRNTETGKATTTVYPGIEQLEEMGDDLHYGLAGIARGYVNVYENLSVHLAQSEHYLYQVLLMMQFF